MSDAIVGVLENYKSWLGEPSSIVYPERGYPDLLPKFYLLEYSRENYSTVCTVGASQEIIPGSQGKFDGLAVAYEYLAHSSKPYEQVMRDLLLRIAGYPYLVKQFIYSGQAIPIGENLAGVDGLNHVYLTFPYEDDDQIYTKSPKGQIGLDDRLIMVLWGIPIFEKEARMLRKVGAEEFDRLLGRERIPFHNLERAALS